MDSNELKMATAALAKLLVSFQQPTNTDADFQLRSYLEAVKDFEAADVIAAVEKFRRGEASNIDPAFCPSTAQLCIEVRNRKLMRDLWAKSNERLRKYQSPAKEPPQ